MDNLAHKPLEMWGGMECTVNRVGQTYFNQIEQNGHLYRLSDLDLFADLGIKAIRYPIIWESMAPESLDKIDWSWTDERLQRLRELGIRPIASLVHHGSGPTYAPITSPDFALGLADFARQVAARYPWLDAYTPVNEPLTTARFCGLYGIWFPHGRDNKTFVRTLLNECKAVVLSMRAIREINPQAELIQTDDLGRIYSTLQMAPEAMFQNERRWLAFDVLCGRVNQQHSCWQFLLTAGATSEELEWFVANPCYPDVIGINHYPTSDRYLDEETNRYPANTVTYPFAGNPYQGAPYSDVEAVRVLDSPPGGFRERLVEAWERYHLPVSITEAHLCCTREEQLRWLSEAWQVALDARTRGIEVQSVTAWSLLGAFNWNNLVTRDENYYESGVFDIRGPKPRPTALASLIRDLATQQEHDHPALYQPGWWQRPERLLYPPRSDPSYQFDSLSSPLQTKRDKSARPLLILGANGSLGSAFRRACDIRGLAYYAVSRCDFDITDSMALEILLKEARPWAVINACGYSRVDEAESDSDSCFRANTEGAARLAIACAHQGLKLMCFSSHLVFDGTHDQPYVETHAPSPINIYGRSKSQMEQRVLEFLPSALIVRTGLTFGPHNENNFVSRALRDLISDKTIYVEGSQLLSTTYIPHMVDAALDLLIDGESAIWHLTNRDSVSWAELAHLAARTCGIKTGNIVNCVENCIKIASRPIYGVMGTEKGQVLPDLQNALHCYRSSIRAY